LISKLNKLIDAGLFEVHPCNRFSLDEVVDAHGAIGSNFLGRLVLRPALLPAKSK
jgi:hypothetical protein